MKFSWCLLLHVVMLLIQYILKHCQVRSSMSLPLRCWTISIHMYMYLNGYTNDGNNNYVVMHAEMWYMYARTVQLFLWRQWWVKTVLRLPSTHTNLHANYIVRVRIPRGANTEREKTNLVYIEVVKVHNIYISTYLRHIMTSFNLSFTLLYLSHL